MFTFLEAGVNGQVLWLCALLVKQTRLSETVGVSPLCLRLQQVQTWFSTGPGFWGFGSPLPLRGGEAGLTRAEVLTPLRELSTSRVCKVHHSMCLVN